MHHRYDKSHIPIELLRTLVAVSELGSFTKAGDELGLTQPAVSAQVKRLQAIIGGDIFLKPGVGFGLTDRGAMVVGYARRILAMNDQILSLSGSKARSRSFRIGIPNVLASTCIAAAMEKCPAVFREGRPQFRCDPPAELTKNLISGHLDIVIVPSITNVHTPELAGWTERHVWVCAPDFVLSPGSPIPLLSWPNGISDRIAMEALEAAGLSCTVVFVATDLSVHLAAVRAGAGFFVLPERIVPADLKIAREFYLPELPKTEMGIYLREGLDPNKYLALAEALRDAVGPDAESDISDLHVTRARKRVTG